MRRGRRRRARLRWPEKPGGEEGVDGLASSALGNVVTKGRGGIGNSVLNSKTGEERPLLMEQLLPGGHTAQVADVGAGAPSLFLHVLAQFRPLSSWFSVGAGPLGPTPSTHLTQDSRLPGSLPHHCWLRSLGKLVPATPGPSDQKFSSTPQPLPSSPPDPPP